MMRVSENVYKDKSHMRSRSFKNYLNKVLWMSYLQNSYAESDLSIRPLRAVKVVCVNDLQT